MTHLIFTAFPEAEVIAGVATAGIPHGVLVADLLSLPFIYVRSKPKEHGMGNQIEGVLEAGQKVVVVEDLISTGKSSMEAIQAVQQAGGIVSGICSVFHYGFEKAETLFNEAGIPVQSLSHYEALMELATERNMFSEGELASLRAWRQSPSTW